MCGFVVSLGDVNEEQVKNATNEIRYRGPDDTNYFFNHEKKFL